MICYVRSEIFFQHLHYMFRCHTTQLHNHSVFLNGPIIFINIITCTNPIIFINIITCTNERILEIYISIISKLKTNRISPSIHITLLSNCLISNYFQRNGSEIPEESYHNYLCQTKLV